MSYTDFLEMYAKDVKKTPEALLAQLPLTFPVSTNQRGEALVDFFQRTVELNLEGKNVLDIGCAYGGLSIALARAGAKVSAVDVNPRFIEYAQTNAKGAAELDLRVFDASSIAVRKAFKKGSFELIVLNDVLEHIYDTTSLAANLDYLLSETGLVYFKVPNGSSPRFALSEGHRKIFGLTLLDPDCWFHLYPKRASIFYRPLNYFKSIFSYHGLGEISFVNEENVFPRFPIKKLRRQVREVALHAREFEYPNKTVKVYLRHGITRFREEFEYDVENHSEEYVKFKYGSYFFTGFAGRSNSGVRARGTVRQVVGIGTVIDPHGAALAPTTAEIDAGDDIADDAPVSEPMPDPVADSDSVEEVCSNCGARLALGQACPSCEGPGPGGGLDTNGAGGRANPTADRTNGASATHGLNGAQREPVASLEALRFELADPEPLRNEGDDSPWLFLPSFDVPELRARIAQTPLRPYERFERDSAMKPDLEKLVQEGWSKLGAAPIGLKPPINWRLEDRGIMHRLHSWEPLSALLVGAEKHSDRRWFDAAYAAILDWLRQFQEPALRHQTEQQLDAAIGQREDMVWYDMGVGFRCYRIAYVLDVVARDPSYSDADVELLVRSLYFHNAALARPSFYRPQHNHGIYQALGQLGCARRFPWLPKMDVYGALAAQRIERLCEAHFFDSGVHKEHSPGYQYMVLNTMIGARNAGLLDGTRCRSLLLRAEQALMWMVMPDGRVVPIGDTDPRSLKLANVSDVIYQDPHLSYLISSGKTGEAPPAAVKSYGDAGYVFARLPSAPDQEPHQWSYLAQISGFHSRTHKHADHLSFVWFERGQEVLTDPGRYGYLGRTEPRSALAKEGYWYSNPKRMYVESTRAHNAVEIDGRDLPRAGIQPFGSAIINAADQDGLVVTQCKATFFGSVTHERVLLLRAGLYLVVVDSLVDLDDAPRDFSQRFNFAPHWDVEESGLGFCATSTRDGGAALQARSLSRKATASVVSRARNEPTLLGWYSDAENSMVPASSVAFTRGQTPRALFVTVFAFGDKLDVEPIGSDIDGLSELSRFSFAVDGRRTTLELARDAASAITVKRTEEALARSPSAATAAVSIGSSASPRVVMERAQKRRLAITVDVEAQPGRAGQDHVERLIWGRHPSGTAGIDEMMSIADKHGAKLTMYLDYPELHLYGESLLDVGREIHRRGHDLQLHLHQQFFDDAFYRRHGISRVHDLNTVSAESARVFADFLCEQHTKITGSPPKGFRGGGYRFNAALLQALVDSGVTVDSSYQHSHANATANVGPRSQFRWACGAIEVPVSNVFDFKGTKRFVAYNFNASILEGKKTLDSVVRHFDYLERFYKDYGEDAIAVLVMHSFSFLRLGASGHWEYSGSAPLERFDALLEALNGAVEFVTTPQLTELSAKEQLPTLDWDQLQVAPGSIAIAASPAQVALPGVASAQHGTSDTVFRVDECSICGVPQDQFQDYNGPRRRCSGCGSLERQRVLADLYASVVKDAAWRDLRGKRVFIIAPSVSETQFLKRIGVENVVSVDVRPEAKPDLVADVCNMPHVPDGSFDAVVGSYVLTCVHDVRAALREFTRILRPGGVLYTSDPIAKGKRTEEYTEIEKITSWYGREAYDKYKVGSFRSLGELDVKELYPAQLAVQELSGVDAATGTAVSWHIAAKFADGVRPSGWHDRVEAPDCTGTSAPVRGGALVACKLSVVGCPLCGDKLETYEKDQNCHGCGSRARLRALHSVVAEFAGELKRGPLQLPLLSFAMTGDERRVLKGVFEQFKSVSLFGSYSSEHELGVDTRDLSRYSDNSFAGHYGSLIFDYFEEHEQALAEAFRVIAPGGVLLTHIAPYRLTDDLAPARVVGKIQQRQGYFDYVPKEVNLPDVKVGRAWFIAAMQRAGFEVKLAQVQDVATGIVIDWFIGVKPGLDSRSGDTASASTGGAAAAGSQARSGTSVAAAVAWTTKHSHTFSTPLDSATGFKRVIVTVDVPSVPTAAAKVEFACHSFDTDSGSAGDSIYAVQKGGVLVSEDLGAHWDFVRTPDTRDARLWNAFATQQGNVLLQGYKKEGANPDPDARPPLFVCDRGLRVVEELRLGTESWHGPRAIDQSHGTMIYAEYPENSVKYRPDFADKQAEYLPFCRDSAVYRSTDGGRSWSKVFEKSWREIRHFHTVAADPHERGVWYLSSGDKPHESRIWRSSNDGLSWSEVTADGLSVELHPAMKGLHQAVNRYTDIVILPDRVIWGADDLLGNLSQFADPNATFANRVGSRVFVSPKTSPLEPRTIGYVGNHIRSIVDVGPGYVILTEAKSVESGLRPQVCLLLKSEPERVVELFTVDRHVPRGTGFSYSRASRAAKNGRFFSYRDSNDVFPGGPNLLQWDINFE